MSLVMVRWVTSNSGSRQEHAAGTYHNVSLGRTVWKTVKTWWNPSSCHESGFEGEGTTLNVPRTDLPDCGCAKKKYMSDT